VARQHADLTAERWAAFPPSSRILMIGNEMNRGARLLADGDLPRLRSSYERVLRLADLTVECDARDGLRKELLRWRDLVAALYVAETLDPDAHRAAFRAVLRLDPEAARQVELLDATRTRDDDARG
jgi:hypothetical protein